MHGKLELLVEKVCAAWKKKQKRCIAACPPEETLALLSIGRLAGIEAERVRAHIVACPCCARNLAIAIRASSSAQEFVPEELIEMVKEKTGKGMFHMDVVLRLAGSFLEVIKTTGEIMQPQAPAPVGSLRGKKGIQSREVTIRKDFRFLQIELTIENQSAGFFNLTACAWKKGAIFRGIRYSLMKDGMELESYLPDQGKALFEKVSGGAYVLSLASSRKPIAKITLDVRP